MTKVPPRHAALLSLTHTHSDIVCVDVVWTRSVWFGVFYHNSCRVNCKDDVQQMNAQRSEQFWNHTDRMAADRLQAIKTLSLCSAMGCYVVSCLFFSLFPQEVGETGNDRLLRNSQGRIFLYLFLLLFSGFWPSFRGYSSLHSCCWSTFIADGKRKTENWDW